MHIVDYAIPGNFLSTSTYEALRQRPLLLFKTHWSFQHHRTLNFQEGFFLRAKLSFMWFFSNEHCYPSSDREVGQILEIS